MEINNREIATLVWLGIIIGAILLSPMLRSSLLAVFQALFQRIFIIVFALATTYIVLCVLALERIGVWTWDNLKSTIVWTLSFAFVTIFDANRIDEERTYFRKTVRDTINVTALLIFITQLQSFHVVVELMLLPAMTFLVLLHTFAETKPDHAIVTRFLSWVTAIAGFGFFTYSIVETVQNWPKFEVGKNLRELTVPILLSLMFLPFLYILSVFMVYDRVFSGFNWIIKDDGLRRLTKRKAILSFGLNIGLLKRWRRMVMTDRPEQKEEINRTITQTKRVYRREKNPPLINPQLGWSPYTAMRFLDQFDIEMEDYHQLFDRWRASSKLYKLDKKALSNLIAFYVEGDELRADELTLELTVNYPESAEDADKQFTSMMIALLHKAVGPEGAAAFIGEIVSDAVDAMIDGFRIKLAREDWSLPTMAGYERSFIIEHSAKPQPPAHNEMPI